ncbi:hypothetical protein LHK_02481 [Laribacter hongkongensis HLHK9]|uniref:Uncharacterized protein n=1 Tax=Laribacter hongkongensis (strain HLHK9) TaxID=557598 RepID=C1DBR0_LARHH|nr:hypothetical protein LHK_02481 [Laribacter hongkongensis HLHK9]
MRFTIAQPVTDVGPICGFCSDEKEKALNNQGFDLACWRPLRPPCPVNGKG